MPDVIRIGSRVLRSEDHALLTGSTRYLADVAHHDHPGHLHAAFVRSHVAFGTVTAIDTWEAEAVPGVVAVFTAADLGLGAVRGHHMLPPSFDRPPLADGTVRFVGDPVAVVVATSRPVAVDAAGLVQVDVDHRSPAEPVALRVPAGRRRRARHHRRCGADRAGRLREPARRQRADGERRCPRDTRPVTARRVVVDAAGAPGARRDRRHSASSLRSSGARAPGGRWRIRRQVRTVRPRPSSWPPSHAASARRCSGCRRAPRTC